MAAEIKICGLKTENAMRAALDGGASYVGFIFFPKSPRYIEPELARRLRDQARNRAKAVAVTVDADDVFLDRIMRGMDPDIMQLHGSETPARVAEIKRRFGLPIIKALSISTTEDIAGVRPYLGAVDRFLLDAKPPKGSDLPGGNGVSFDWSLLRDAGGDLNYFLAGGLNANNVGDAIRIANPPALDISSGVESAPGVKDVGLIDGFFRAFRKAAGA